MAPLNIELDLRAERIACHVDLDAPKEGRPKTRVNWLLRQLKGAPETLGVEAFAAHGRGTSTAALLKDLQEDAVLEAARQWMDAYGSAVTSVDCPNDRQR